MIELYSFYQWDKGFYISFVILVGESFFQDSVFVDFF